MHKLNGVYPIPIVWVRLWLSGDVPTGIMSAILNISLQDGIYTCMPEFVCV